MNQTFQMGPSDQDAPTMLQVIELYTRYIEDIQIFFFLVGGGEHSGSVVECLTRDRGAAGSSLTGVTAPGNRSKKFR